MPWSSIRIRTCNGPGESRTTVLEKIACLLDVNLAPLFPQSLSSHINESFYGRLILHPPLSLSYRWKFNGSSMLNNQVFSR